MYLQVNRGKCCLWIAPWRIVLAMNNFAKHKSWKNLEELAFSFPFTYYLLTMDELKYGMSIVINVNNIISSLEYASVFFDR